MHGFRTRFGFLFEIRLIFCGLVGYVYFYVLQINSCVIAKDNDNTSEGIYSSLKLFFFSKFTRHGFNPQI